MTKKKKKNHNLKETSLLQKFLEYTNAKKVSSKRCYIEEAGAKVKQLEDGGRVRFLKNRDKT